MLYNSLIITIALAVSLTFFGKAVIGILMGVAVLIAFAILWQERKTFYAGTSKRHVVFSKEKISIVVMLLIWLASAMQGIKPEESTAEVLEYTGIIIGGLVIFTALNTGHLSFDRFIRWTVIPAAFCATWLALTPYLGDFAVEWGSSYGAVLAVIMPFALYQAWKKPRQLKYWLCVFLITVGVFASGSRTAWLAFTLIVVLFPFLYVWRDVHRKVLKIGLMGLLLVCAAFAGMNVNKQVIGEDYFNYRKESMFELDRPASGRLTIWQNTIPLIEERPLLGHGIKSAYDLQIKKSDEHKVIHVHNAVLEMWLETGLLGLLSISVVIVVFVGHFLISFFRSYDIRLKQQGATIFMACITYGVCSMALTSMFHAWWFLYLVVLLILLKSAEIKLRRTAR
jgi:hypothetical protein